MNPTKSQKSMRRQNSRAKVKRPRVALVSQSKRLDVHKISPKGGSA